MICSQPNAKSVIPFGAYLVSKNLITPGELEASLICQSERNPKLGRLAVDRQLLTFPKIREIYEYQLSHSVPFGKAAVILGFLNKEEVDSLLEEQAMHHKLLGEVLVDLQVISPDRLKEVLASYFSEIGELRSETRTAPVR